LLNKVVTPYTKNGKLLVLRGAAMGGVGDTRGALIDFDRAIAVDSNSISLAYSGRANVKMELKQYDGAVSDISKAIEKDQNNDDAYFIRANLKMIQKNYEGAVYDYISVLLINPDNIKTYAYRGLAEAYTKDTAAMNGDFKQAMKLSPGDGNNYILRAKARMFMRDYDEGLSDFAKAIALNPRNYDTWLSRGIAKLQENDKSGCTDLNKAVELGSKDAVEELRKYCK
jgi:tetratricopeptide (TPR) repeat protein